MSSNDVARLMPACLLAVSLACAGDPTAGKEEVVADTASEIITCADGLVRHEEDGICAPRLDECEHPWELPLVVGGCLAIGPRACPRGWTPHAGVDCKAGELMDYDGSACPEGYVLTKDEVACIPFFEENCGATEIPIMGGGCRKVGPDFGGDGGPYFDHCEPGHLALPGGGCAQVGPRGCPKLWESDSDLNCQVGDLLSCPEGWAESKDGLSCDPGLAECGPGERALPGGDCRRIVQVSQECPPGPFPEAPEGAGEVVYVSAASSCTEGCGSSETPFSDITSALAAAPPGGYVLVGEGDYPEGIAIDKPVHVIGLCSARVTLSGSVNVPHVESRAPMAGIAISHTADVEVGRVRITSPDVGVAVVEATGVKLDRMELSGGAGLYAGPDSEIQVQDLWVHNTTASTDFSFTSGYGIWASGGTVLAVTEALVDSVRGVGIYITDPGTAVEVTHSEIRNTLPLGDGSRGRGLMVTDAATVQIEHVLVDGNREVGLLALGEAGLTATFSVIRGTKPNQNGDYGWGMQGSDAAVVTLSDCVLEGNTHVAVAAFHSETQLDLARTVVRETKPHEKGKLAMGILMQLGGKATFSGCLLEENADLGVAVFQPGSWAGLSGTVIRGTKLDKQGGFGSGVEVQKGGSATLLDCLFEGNAGAGVAAFDPGSQLGLSGTVVRNREPDEGGDSAIGLAAGAGALVEASACLFEANITGGVTIFNAGTRATLSDTVVRETKANGQGVFGYGVQVLQGASALLSNCLLEGNTEMGIVAFTSGTQVQLLDTVVRDTRPDQHGQFGRGLQVAMSAAATVSGCLFDENEQVGVVVAHPGTRVDFAGSVVRGTRPNQGDVFGTGVQVTEGAAVSLSGCLLEGNNESGIAAFDSGTEVELSATVVRDTSSHENGAAGFGVEAGKGAAVTVSDCLISGNAKVGVAVFDSGTKVGLTGTVVEGHEPGAEGAGLGMQVSLGSVAMVSGCLLERNATVGAIVVQEGSEAVFLGTIVRDTAPNESGSFGPGLGVAQRARATASACLFESNTTGGVATAHEGTVVSLDRCAVLDTQKGGMTVEAEEGWEVQVFGDGVLAAEGATLEVISTIVMGNERTGAYFHGSSGRLEDSVVVANSSYGLAMENSAEDVDFLDKGNFIFGNSLNMPASGAADITASPKGLPVPPPPELVGVPDRGEQ